MSEFETPNRGNGCSEYPVNYLEKAAEACAAGDLVLGMHLYLAAYEKSAADPNVPDGTALTGLREAWHLACDLKERSMAEYVFEKMEPYLTPDEISECANQLQDLALDRLEQIGFSREELQNVAQMITQDLAGVTGASVVKVESVSIPHADMFGVPGVASVQVEGAVVASGPVEPADEAAGMGGAEAGSEVLGVPSGSEGAGDPPLRLADANDFNPYDAYRDYSIGKSWHAATNEGSGADVFTRDAERAEAHERFVEAGGAEALAAANAARAAGGSADGEDAAGSDAGTVAVAAAETGADDSGRTGEMPSMPVAVEVGQRRGGYATLSGYDEAVSIMRDFGIGMQGDRDYLDFIAMLNERHGLDRAPALDSLLLRAPAIEDASRFAEATIEELGLPALHMSIEESVMGMPVLCVSTQGNNRPRMNHAHNRFEAPAVLVIDDLDMWTTPEAPENVEGGMSAFVMANLSRGAREAMNLIRSAVEDPDVCVIATATTSGDVDPFYYEMLEPMTVIDIGLPNEKERADLWAEIAQDHPSIRDIDQEALVRYSAGIPRCDMYLAVREAVEEAYKLGLVQRSYVPVAPQNIFEKLAACQPLESDAYHEIEDEVIRRFQEDLDNLDDLIDGPRD